MEDSQPPGVNPIPVQQEPQTLQFEFRGNGWEFFKIWIVNTVLTVITLGIFSAWAKVRTKRYLYGNSYLGGQNFEYLADPIKILKGRLIVGGFFVLYLFSGYVHFALPIIFLLILVGLTPFIIVKSIAFNLAYTSHRNIRFRFEKDYPEAYKRYFLWVFIMVITIYIGFPAALRRFYDYLFNRVKYGDTKFTFKNTESLYPIYIGAFFLNIAIVVGLGLIAGALYFVVSMLSATIAVTGAAGFIAVGYFAFIIAAYGDSFYVYAVIRTWTFEYFARQLFIDDIRLESHLVASELGMLNFTNFLLILFTVGLGTPWAIIRFRRYTLEKLSLVLPSKEKLDQFVSSQSKSESAEGDAAADIFDVDFDFGF